MTNRLHLIWYRSLYCNDYIYSEQPKLDDLTFLSNKCLGSIILYARVNCTHATQKISLVTRIMFLD